MTTKTAVAMAALLLPGCYQGLDLDGERPGGALSGGVDSSGDSAGDGGDDGGDDSGGTVEELCADPDVGFQPLRRLTRTQYTNTIQDLLGIDTDVADSFPLDERVGAFESNAVAPVSDLVVEQYMGAAEQLAVDALAVNGETIIGCDPAVDGEAPCAESFIDTFGKRVHRRPLTDEERTLYLGLFADGQADGGFDHGVRLVLQAMLQSPHFLYHVELGDPSLPGPSDQLIALTQYELASRLSYFLWSSMPDDELLQAADAGALGTREALAEQAERMLADPRSEAVIESFHLQWLHIDNMTTVEKDPTLFPDFSETLKESMQRDVAEFASHVIREDDGSLRTLLTASYTLTDDPDLLNVYGVSLPTDHTPGDPIALDPNERAGLITQPALLAKAAHVDQSSPVHRGVVIRENFLCQPLPTPPDDVDDTPPDPDPNATTRERFAEHTSNPECAGCHSLIDGIGFGFENYDAVGAFRTMEGELPVDASGEIIGTKNIDGAFDGAVELANKLADSVDVQQCVSQQWFNFALGRVPGPQDDCATAMIYEEFEASDFDLRALLVSVAQSDSFRYRNVEEGV